MKKLFFGLAVCVCLSVASSAWAYYVTDTGDPNERVCNPHSYTDLGNGIVRDNVTGLEWQQATAPGTYTWAEAVSYCNDLMLGSYSDWRLPTIEELATLVEADRGTPVIDPAFVTPEPQGEYPSFHYWSSTKFAQVKRDVAWYVTFEDGRMDYPDEKDNSIYVRAVRGSSYGSLDNLVVNGNGMVTDTDTGLVWQQCNYGQTWNGATCTGTAAILTQDQAVAYVQELNTALYLGHGDWRLPTKNELQSIMNYSQYNPATTFPNTIAAEDSVYLSSTVQSNFPGFALKAGFWDGYFFSAWEEEDLDDYVRVVRGGACGDWCTDDDDCEQGQACEGKQCVAVCLNNSDCDDNLFCTGVETCADQRCVAGTVPCEAGEACDEGIDQCFTEGCDEEWDLDGDCDADKEDSKLLSNQQKAEKTSLSTRHKAEKAEIKAAMGSSGDCDEEWDLDEDCDVDKDDSSLLKLQQKAEKTDLSTRHKTEKAAMKAALL